MNRFVVFLSGFFSFGVFAAEFEYQSFKRLEGGVEMSNFSAVSKACDMHVKKWEKNQGDASGNNTRFFGAVEFEIEGKHYETEELWAVNFKLKKNCQVKAKLVFLKR